MPLNRPSALGACGLFVCLARALPDLRQRRRPAGRSVREPETLPPQAKKKRTRPGPLDDQPHLMKFCNGARATLPAQGFFAQIRSRERRKSSSPIGRASSRLRRRLLIHQTCRPPKARANRPSWIIPQLSGSITSSWRSGDPVEGPARHGSPTARARDVAGGRPWDRPRVPLLNPCCACRSGEPAARRLHSAQCPV